MKRAQSILTGATALALAVAGATAFIVESSADRLLILEQSDSLA